MTKKQNSSTVKTFKSEFLEHYMSVSVGALSKKDTDALVMHLLDKYGIEDGVPLAIFPNQEVSALLRIPAVKVRQLRYEAGLKYGGRVEDQAKAKLLLALNRSVLEIESKTVCLVLEDALAKNWLQGQLKNNGLIFDHSFNTEIIKVKTAGLFQVLGQVFDKTQTKTFESAFEKLLKEKKDQQLRDGFAKLAEAFAAGAARAAGGAVAQIFGISAG